MLTSTEERSLCVVPEPATALVYPRPRLGLSRHDAQAVAAFASGDTRELLEDARQLADALAGEDGDGARVRLLARAAAAARAQQRALEVILGRCLAQRDYDGVEAVGRCLDSISKKVVMYCRHLAFESSLRRRPTVVIRHADRVEFGEGA